MRSSGMISTSLRATILSREPTHGSFDSIDAAPGSSLTPHRFQVPGQAVERLLTSLDRSHLFDGAVASLGRLIHLAQGNLGRPVALDEGDRHLEVDALLIFAVEVDEALGLDDLRVPDVVLKVHSVRSVHHKAPLTAGTQLHLLRRRGEAVWSPPVPNVLRVGPGRPHKLPRGVEAAGDDDLPVRREGGLHCVANGCLSLKTRCHLCIPPCRCSALQSPGSFGPARFLSRSCSVFRYLSSRSKLPSQKLRYRSTQLATSRSGVASRRHGRHWARRSCLINPARWSTFRCFVIAGALMSKGSASSFTVASPSASRSRMARRVGSASAEKRALR